MRFLALFLRPVVVAVVLGTSLHGEQEFRSGIQQVTLVELFTSEGCSSCPPAESRLGELRNDPGLWRDFVPIAFHVNYWDRLGWRDSFASKPFTDRQYAYSANWNSTSVYTPCFVRNGVEWRPHGSTPISEGHRSDVGPLNLTWDEQTKTCRVEFEPMGARDSPRSVNASVALLGGGIVSDIRRGENAGRKLAHEFVALQLQVVPLKQEKSGRWSGTITLAERPDLIATRLALAGWVTTAGRLAPIQAVGGWLKQ